MTTLLYVLYGGNPFKRSFIEEGIYSNSVY
ncbi:hypothetical protein FHS14_002951 [Paenibacillus baekrokdamisoli]|nr:hypothetical protein [Paenibacillus baekrokdamisoli]